MSTIKAKFALYQALSELGFTFDEATALRRIEMTLRRWATDECNGDIQRDDKTGKPFRWYYTAPIGANRHSYPIADREAGALKRLKDIVDFRNQREKETHCDGGVQILAYHQTDPRGAALYLVRASDVREGETLDAVYSRGLCVSA